MFCSLEVVVVFVVSLVVVVTVVAFRMVIPEEDRPAPVTRLVSSLSLMM